MFIKRTIERVAIETYKENSQKAQGNTDIIFPVIQHKHKPTHKQTNAQTLSILPA